MSNIKPITVTTYDSAYIHTAKMGDGFGLLIFDEEHHLPDKCRHEASTLADFDVVHIPAALNDSEQATYDQCSRIIQHFITTRRKELPCYTWHDLCKESGKDPQARHAQRAYYLKQSIVEFKSGRAIPDQLTQSTHRQLMISRPFFVMPS